jgi:hypothetical protein
MPTRCAPVATHASGQSSDTRGLSGRRNRCVYVVADWTLGCWIVEGGPYYPVALGPFSSGWSGR